MNETETVTEDTVDQAVSLEAPDVAVQTLVDAIDDLATTVNVIQTALSNGLFKHLSKTARNTLHSAMLDQAAAVDDTARAVFRQLKRVKRVHMPDDTADRLIIGARALQVLGQPSEADAVLGHE